MKKNLNTITGLIILFLITNYCLEAQTNVNTFNRPIWAGFYTNPSSNTPIDVKKFPFIKGLGDRIKWRDCEPSDSVYNWSAIDNQLSLAAENQYYYYFVTWNGPDCPSWIYTKGIRKVNTDFRVGSTYPYYLDPKYIYYFHRYIDKLADHLATLPVAQRNALAFIQPAFGSTGDQQLYKGNLLNPVLDTITDQQYFDFCSAAASRFYLAFNKPELSNIKFLFNIEDDSGTKPTTQLTGQQLFGNWMRANHTIELRKQQYTTAVGYQANSEITQDTAQRSSFFGLNGKVPDIVRGEFSIYATGAIFQENPIWNYYWTALSTVDRGLDLWETDYNAVATGLYNEGFIFSNKYSYYKKPETSPYAFIALRDVLDANDTKRFPTKDYGTKMDSTRFKNIQLKYASYGAKIGDMNAATTLVNAVYLLNAKAMNDVGSKLIARNYSRFITQMDANNTSAGWWRVGPVNQPYGRYARGFENATSKNRMYFDLDDQFFANSTTGKSVDIKIIYLDEGLGKFSFRYDSKNNPDSIAQIITKKDTKKWVETTIHIDNGSFSNLGYKASDFSLVNEDTEDDIFHMIEVSRSPTNFNDLKIEKNQQSLIFNQTNSVLSWSENVSIDVIEIYNSNGNEIQKLTDLISNNINLSTLKRGVYFCRLFKNNKIISSYKFIKL